MRLFLLVVMRHLQSCSFEATLNVETLICLAAIQDTLVAANLFGNEIKRLDEFQSELFALLIFSHCNIFNVSDDAQIVDARGLLAGQFELRV